MLEKTTVKIFFFGDSICFGQGVSPNRVWVNRIAEDLMTGFPSVDIVVQNPSVNGNTTRMALERIAYDVQSHQPDVLIIQFGMNDCNVWQTDHGHTRVSPMAFKANLHEMVDRGRIFGARRVILGTNHPSTRTGTMPQCNLTYQDSNRAFNALTRQVAREKDVRLVDMEAAIELAVKNGATFDDFVLADQLHLSHKGHAIYAQEYGPVVKDAVRHMVPAD